MVERRVPLVVLCGGVIEPFRDVLPARVCTVCKGRGKREPATFVAAAADGLEWFECDGHGELDNGQYDVRGFGSVRRVARVPIAEWFKRGLGGTIGR